MNSRIVSLRLGEIIRFCNEKRINLSRRQCEQQSGEYPYYGPQGIIAHINTFACEGEYLLLAESRPRNSSAVQVFPVSGRFSANTHVHVLACIEEVEPRFLARRLDALPRAFRSLRPGDIENIEISLPPPEDQRQILAAVLDIERKIVLLKGQNRLLDGMAQSLFDRCFMFGGGKFRPLGDFVISRTAAPPDPGLYTGTAFHNLLLYPREDLSPLFTRTLIKNPDFLAHAKNCLEYRGGRRQLNAELLMTFELSGPVRGGASFPAGAYPEFNAFALGAEKKLAANNTELKLLADLGQSLFPL
ncbi:MAG: restriction endonuclease subunit S [Treponema sp.]|jgi:hypothetical protein|nr:restriction endonuclease subunit S [Treponema sp.]